MQFTEVCNARPKTAFCGIKNDVHAEHWPPLYNAYFRKITLTFRFNTLTELFKIAI